MALHFPRNVQVPCKALAVARTAADYVPTTYYTGLKHRIREGSLVTERDCEERETAYALVSSTNEAMDAFS